MKRTIVRFVSVCWILAGIATIVPGWDCHVVCAAEASDFTYSNLEDGTLEITGYNGAEENLVIPNEIDGKTVTGIGESAFEKNSTIKSVTLPDGLQTIGSYCFSSTYLQEITIPNGVVSIGSYCFSNTYLQEITIPDSVVSIGSSSFMNCKFLTAATILGKVTKIESSTFNGCTKLASVTLPDSVRLIEYRAFLNCNSLKNITLPRKVRGIGEGAFGQCGALETIGLPEKVINIGEDAFWKCNVLSDVYYEGTEEQWADISIDSGNNLLKNAGIHYGSELGYEPSGDADESNVVYTVTFDARGVLDIPSQEVEEGDIIRRPQDPVRPEYTFLGWYLGDEKWDFLCEITGDMTLTAKWEAEEKVYWLAGSMYDKDQNKIIITGKEWILDAGEGVYNQVTGYKWTTQNAGIIRMQSGTGDRTCELKAISPGVCTVTAAVTSVYYLNGALWDQQTQYNEHKFRVVDSITEIRMDAETMNLKPGESAPLDCTTTPAGNYAKVLSGFVLSCSDPEVAVISEDGIVTATGLGTAQITACTADGVRASCIVTVSEGGTSDAGTTPSAPENPGETSDSESGEPEEKTEESSDTVNSPAKGTVLKDNKNKISYKVLTKDKTVAFYKMNDKKAKKAAVPATVTFNGIKYKVTAISDSAFSGCKNLKSVTIGKYVATIGKKAFYKCTSLKKITIPASVTKIGKKAFYGDKKLKSVVIKSKKLTSKTVGKQAFEGIHKKAVIQAPKAQEKAYKKWLVKKGITKTMVIKS